MQLVEHIKVVQFHLHRIETAEEQQFAHDVLQVVLHRVLPPGLELETESKVLTRFQTVRSVASLGRDDRRNAVAVAPYSHVVGQDSHRRLVEAACWANYDCGKGDLRNWNPIGLLRRCRWCADESQVIVSDHVAHPADHGEEDEQPHEAFSKHSSRFGDVSIAVQEGFVEIGFQAGHVAQRRL